MGFWGPVGVKKGICPGGEWRCKVCETMNSSGPGEENCQYTASFGFRGYQGGALWESETAKKHDKCY